MSKIKVCIYSLDAYQLLTGSKQDHIGGAAVQTCLLGRELSKQNNIEVSFVVFGNGQQHEIVDGIHIYKTKPRMYLIENGGLLPLMKIMAVNWKILKAINADIYYTRGSGKYSGLIALFCFLHRKKFILGMASDKDVDGSFEKEAKFYEKISYLVAVKLSSSVISQNKLQKKLLKNRFKKDSIQINNMNSIPTHDIVKNDPPIVIWVGTIKSVWKQPEIFLKLAQEIPDAQFQMIGGPSSDIHDIELYERIKQSATKIPNLKLVGFVPYNEVKKYFDEASILVNTSSVEGFSNTFIEAWMRYVPIVSLNVDPDGIISENKLGFHSRTFEQMVKDLRMLLNDKEFTIALGNNCRRYAESEFNINNIIKSYVSLFNQLIGDYE